MKKHESSISEIELAAYCEGTLAKVEHDAIERVLADSRSERSACALIKRVLIDQEDHGTVPERAMQKVLRMYPKSTGLFDLVVSLAKGALAVVRSSPEVAVAAPLQYAAVRTKEAGDSSVVVMTRTFDRAKVDVHVEHVGRSECSFTVRATDTIDGMPLKQARMDLLSGSRELASSPLDNGTALFEEVRPGRYDLILKKNNAVIGRMTIKIIGA